MRPVEVEHAEPADAEALAAIFTAARRHAMPWLPELHSEAEDRHFIADRVMGVSDVLVARRTYQPVGFVSLRDDMVEHLYVRPDAQRPVSGRLC